VSYLTLAKRLEAKLETQGANPEAAPSVHEGDILAVLIDSPIVGPVWFAFDDERELGDDIPVFFASELPALAKMTGADLRRRYEEKLALCGGWIRDRTDEPTKH
jgi:hypothetical protein